MNIAFNVDKNQLYTVRRSPHLAHKTMLFLEEKIPMHTKPRKWWLQMAEERTVLVENSPLRIRLENGDITLSTPQAPSTWTNHYMHHDMSLLKKRFSYLLNKCNTFGYLELPQQENMCFRVMNVRWALENGFTDELLLFLHEYRPYITEQDLQFLSTAKHNPKLSQFVLSFALQGKGTCDKVQKKI